MEQELNQNKSIKGMPKGIPFIIGNEAAERFSYYGMKAILTIFMVDYLKMTETEASTWYHNFGNAVYFLPIVGAFLSDLFLGKYRTILTLSLVYCAGHLVLALNESQTGLLWGLSLIAIGSGGIKPCVSAHVGDQFNERNKALVNKVFNLFYFAINFGSFFSTLLIPFLLNSYGPGVAFGLPGVLMFLATFVFWLGRKEYVHIPANPDLFLKELFTRNALKIGLRLGLVYLFIAVFWALYEQTGSSWIIQANTDLMDKTIDLGFWKFTVLPSQIQTINPILVMILVPIFAFVLYPWLGKRFNFKPLYKILAGMVFCGLSFLVIASIEKEIHAGHQTHVYWQLFAYLLLTIGEVLLSLTALEYSYTQAPVSLKSIVMGLYLLSVSLGNKTIVLINNFVEEKLEVTHLTITDQLILETPKVLNTGDKININKSIGLLKASSADTLKGTFLVEKLSDKTYTLWDANRKAIKVTKASNYLRQEQESMHAFSSFAVNGPDYFTFYAYLMFVASLLFLPFAIFLKDRTYLQS
jgi:proton-dependent oligopeptide transporter, POT family